MDDSRVNARAAERTESAKTANGAEHDASQKLLQDAKLSGITVKDIARALATMAGVKAVSDFDAGFTRTYLDKAEALLDLATEFAQERRRND